MRKQVAGSVPGQKHKGPHGPRLGHTLQPPWAHPPTPLDTLGGTEVVLGVRGTECPTLSRPHPLSAASLEACPGVAPGGTVPTPDFSPRPMSFSCFQNNSTSVLRLASPVFSSPETCLPIYEGHEETYMVIRNGGPPQRVRDFTVLAPSLCVHGAGSEKQMFSTGKSWDPHTTGIQAG